LALADENNELSFPFEFAMAAAVQAMRNDPANIIKAKWLDYWPEWNKSIQHELDKHKKMHIWELIKPPDEVKIVGSHFVFQYKHDMDSNIASQKLGWSHKVSHRLKASTIEKHSVRSKCTALLNRKHGRFRRIRALASAHALCLTTYYHMPEYFG